MSQAQKTLRNDRDDASNLLRIEPQVYCYTACQNVSIGIWVGQATLSAVRGLSDVGAQMSQRCPEGHSSIVFILDKLPAPTPEARDLLTRILQGAHALTCTAVILEGSGFWASGIRSMIGNTHRAADSDVRLRISTTIDEVLEWLPREHLKCTGVELNLEQLRAALLDLRTHGVAAALNA